MMKIFVLAFLLSINADAAAKKVFNGQVYTAGGLYVSDITASTVPYLDTNKKMTSSAVTPSELSYVNGVTSSIQTQLNAKAASGNYITALTGDVTAAGPGSSAATLAATSNGTLATLSKSSGVAVHGTNTNDSASAGYNGEVYRAANGTAADVPGSTGQWGDITSNSFSAGDWDITMCVESRQNGATVTDWQIGCGGTVSGNDATNLTSGDNRASFTVPTAAFPNVYGCVPNWRVSLSGSTTLYFKILSSYSVANPQYRYRISARRVR